MREIALVLLLATACARAGGTPRIELSEEPAGAPERRALAAGTELVRARFRLRNGGAGRLVLRALVPDCACRVGRAGAEALAPGESVEIAAACRAVAGAGEPRRIRLLSNDPAAPETVLAVRMPARVPAAAPAALFFGHVAVGSTAVREIVLRPGVPGARPVVDSETFAVEPAPAGPGGAPAYRVRFAPRAPGVVRATLDAGGDAAPLLVAGVGVVRVAAFPAEVHLPSAVAEGVPAVVLKNLGAAPLAIVGVDLPAGLAGDLRTVVPGAQYRLALRRAGAGATAPGVDAIRVRTDAADEPVLVVPVVRERDPARAG